ncbi:MAG: hypothetical protein E7062_01325 [Spirochaetaceae bacterium]|nr:hypothetical protein [Spirochaetaceae bacterium]
MTTIQKVLSVLMVSIIFIILLVTFFVYFSPANSIGKNLRKADPSTQELKKDNIHTLFFERLRSATQDEKPFSVIISPYLAYTKTDSAFEEELNKKKRHLQTLIVQFFQTKSYKELKNLSELTIKSILKEKINEQLIMGTIDDVYFDEYIIFD